MKNVGKKNIILAAVDQRNSSQAKALYSRAKKAFGDYNIIKEWANANLPDGKEPDPAKYMTWYFRQI